MSTTCRAVIGYAAHCIFCDWNTLSRSSTVNLPTQRSMKRVPITGRASDARLKSGFLRGYACLWLGNTSGAACSGTSILVLSHRFAPKPRAIRHNSGGPEFCVAGSPCTLHLFVSFLVRYQLVCRLGAIVFRLVGRLEHTVRWTNSSDGAEQAEQFTEENLRVL